jgi:hypothetical protein
VLRTVLVAAVAVVGVSSMARAGDPPPAPADPPKYETVLTVATPLHGSGLPREEVPANVQTVTAAQLAAQHSLDLSAYLGDAVGSVHVNDVQSNPLQPDLQYRGFLASPLLGAPQGLSMYLDGVRLNEPFGDTINWDLIPANAIGSVNVIPGSNPIFGLNTLGGALSIESKNGFSTVRGDASSPARAAARTVTGSACSRRRRSWMRPAGASARRPAPSRRSCRPRIAIRAAPPISRCWPRTPT